MINNIGMPRVAGVDEELDRREAINTQGAAAIANIAHSKRNPAAVAALQELARRLQAVVTDVDERYGLHQYMSSLQLAIAGPGEFRLFLNEHGSTPTTPIGIGKQHRSIELDDYHGERKPSDEGPSPGSEGPGGSETKSGDPAASATGGSGPAGGAGEGLPFASE